MGEDIGDIGEYDFEDDPEEKPFTDLGSLTYEEIRKTYEGISAGLSAMPDPYSSDDSGSLDDDDEDYDDDDDLIDINDSFVKAAARSSTPTMERLGKSNSSVTSVVSTEGTLMVSNPRWKLATLPPRKIMPLGLISRRIFSAASISLAFSSK